jgi:hypothetical protein
MRMPVAAQRDSMLSTLEELDFNAVMVPISLWLLLPSARRQDKSRRMIRAFNSVPSASL